MSPTTARPLRIPKRLVKQTTTTRLASIACAATCCLRPPQRILCSVVLGISCHGTYFSCRRAGVNPTRRMHSGLHICPLSLLQIPAFIHAALHDSCKLPPEPEQCSQHTTIRYCVPISFLSSGQDYRPFAHARATFSHKPWDIDRAATTITDLEPLAVKRDPHHTPPTSTIKSTSLLRQVFLVSGRVFRYIPTDHRTGPHKDLVHIGTTTDSMTHCSIS